MAGSGSWITMLFTQLSCNSCHFLTFPSFLQLALLVFFSPPFPSFVNHPSPSPFPFSHLKTLMFYSYMYEVARRNPFVFSPVLLTVAAQFEEAATTCCEQQEKAICFQAKVSITLVLSKGWKCQCHSSRSSLKIKHYKRYIFQIPYYLTTLTDVKFIGQHWEKCTVYQKPMKGIHQLLASHFGFYFSYKLEESPSAGVSRINAGMMLSVVTNFPLALSTIWNSASSGSHVQGTCCIKPSLTKCNAIIRNNSPFYMPLKSHFKIHSSLNMEIY